MGIGDSIGKAAENAMEDLAGTSDPVEESNVPDPTDPNDDVEVHSSISEGSNAMEAEKEKAPGLKTGAAPGPVSDSPLGGDAEPGDQERGGDGTGTAAPAQEHVAGPGGLPEADPDALRADPSEATQDPSGATDYRTGPSGH